MNDRQRWAEEVEEGIFKAKSALYKLINHDVRHLNPKGIIAKLAVDSAELRLLNALNGLPLADGGSRPPDDHPAILEMIENEPSPIGFILEQK